MSVSARLLLADSQPRRSNLLSKHLRAFGYRVDIVCDGISALGSAQSSSIDVAIIDFHLSDVSGIDVCRCLRDRGSDLPLLVLCPADSYVDRVGSLNAGADDALSCPFALEELSARVVALLRRARIAYQGNSGPVFNCKDLSIDAEARQAVRAGQSLKLTVKEYELLLYLLRHKNQVLPRRQILEAVWGANWIGDDNLLDVYIRYLRKKIEGPEIEPLIHTVRGVGFVLR